LTVPKWQTLFQLSKCWRNSLVLFSLAEFPAE
jgi:hypothetical protein